MSNLRILPDNNLDLWDELYKSGQSKSIYFHKDFISSLNEYFQNYLVFKNDELVAGFTCLLNEDKSSIVSNNFAIYSGFYFASRQNKKVNKQRIERIDLINEVLKIISNRYFEIDFTMSPDVKDIRPFQWYNHGKPPPYFSAETRYTSFLDLSISNDELIKNFSSIRRQQIGYAEKEGLEVLETTNFSNLIKNYERNIVSQGSELSENYFDSLSELINNPKVRNLVRCFEIIRNKKASYSVLFSNLEGSTEYMYGAGDPSIQESYDSTYLIWKVICKMKNEGKSSLNFEGVNSPNRGNYKLSFGGDLQSYYKIRKLSEEKNF